MVDLVFIRQILRGKTSQFIIALFFATSKAWDLVPQSNYYRWIQCHARVFLEYVAIFELMVRLKNIATHNEILCSTEPRSLEALFWSFWSFARFVSDAWPKMMNTNRSDWFSHLISICDCNKKKLSCYCNALAHFSIKFMWSVSDEWLSRTRTSNLALSTWWMGSPDMCKSRLGLETKLCRDPKNYTLSFRYILS